jgi:hypothetical protein
VFDAVDVVVDDAKAVAGTVTPKAEIKAIAVMDRVAKLFMSSPFIRTISTVRRPLVSLM